MFGNAKRNISRFIFMDGSFRGKDTNNPNTKTTFLFVRQPVSPFGDYPPNRVLSKMIWEGPKTTTNQRDDCHTATIPLMYFPKRERSRLFRLFADVGQNTAIDIEYMAVDEVRSIRSQEYGRTHQIFGRTPTRGGRFCNDECVERMT